MNGLTTLELELIRAIGKISDMFMALDGKHPSDNSEFQHHIHILQRHVMCRLARRSHLEFVTHGKHS